MNIGWNIETFLSVFPFVFTGILSFLIIKTDWKKYGTLYLLSAITGAILCYVFIYLHLYSFPYLLFPKVSKIPYTIMLSVFPFFVLVGVKYSPRTWAAKIPFYWTLVHIGVFSEVWSETQTQLIRYGPFWHVWESYTWWWIYLLVFEWVGGLIVPQASRTPIDQEFLKYGKLGWFISHLILIISIFLAGVYTGKVLLK
jgi:hypothetical protein